MKKRKEDMLIIDIIILYTYVYRVNICIRNVILKLNYKN